MFFGLILATVLGVGLFSHKDHLGLASPRNTTAPTPAGQATSATFRVKVTDKGFEPSKFQINQGDTVVFENVSKNDVWPASDIHPTHNIYPEFDPRKHIKPGESWSFKFDKAGNWTMHDHLKPSSHGLITVKGNGADLPTVVEPKKTVPVVSNTTETDFSKINILAVINNNADLTKWLNAVGPKKIMDKLLNDTGGGSLVDCHQQAHTVGRLAYKIFGAPAFGDGNSSCHSGYYHGAMEQLLKEKGTVDLKKTINDICNTFATSFGRFECLHGVGHGVMAYADYDLPEAIKTCKLLGDSYSISSCYGGMFMENVVTGQGSGGTKDHDTKWVSKDPLFPCNGIDQDYEVQYQCYQMQTSWMLTLFKYDFDQVAQECFKARPDMISVCFKSMGRDAAGNSLRNIQKIKDICAKVPDEKDHYYLCIVGATNVIIDFWGDRLQNQATELCKILPETGKRSCYTTLASRLNDLFNSPSQKKAICDGFEPEYQKLCPAN